MVRLSEESFILKSASGATKIQLHAVAIDRGLPYEKALNMYKQALQEEDYFKEDVGFYTTDSVSFFYLGRGFVLDFNCFVLFSRTKSARSSFWRCRRRARARRATPGRSSASTSPAWDSSQSTRRRAASTNAAPRSPTWRRPVGSGRSTTPSPRTAAPTSCSLAAVGGGPTWPRPLLPPGKEALPPTLART